MTFASEFNHEAPLVVVGCGNMGGALLRAWLKAGLDGQHVLVVDPRASDIAPGKVPEANRFAEVSDLAASLSPRAIVLAVKPQIMPLVLPGLAAFDWDSLIISIAAGVEIAALEKAFGEASRVARIMPNTPAAIGKGASVSITNAGASGADKELVGAFASAAGVNFWVEDENLLHVVTGFSGSGPAYFFYMVEALTAAGVEQGLAPDLSAQLARQTFIGAAALADHLQTDMASLRRNVTSPKGTTEAALKLLMGEHGLEMLMRKSLAAAVNRSYELAERSPDTGTG